MSTVAAPSIAPGTHRAATVRRRPLGRGLVHRSINVVLSVLLAGCLLAFLFLAVGPHLLGYRTSTMLTGSMAPGIEAGDVVVTVPKPATDLQVGDVITYQIPVEDHRVETHRVTQVTHEDGEVFFRTKGDANQNDDPWTATVQGDTVWEVRGVVPEAGTAIRVLRAPAVQHGVLWVALGGVILLGLTSIWGKGGDDD
ncbi:signal peptidase I [Nocardioides pyridinolyticus]